MEMEAFSQPRNDEDFRRIAYADRALERSIRHGYASQMKKAALEAAQTGAAMHHVFGEREKERAAAAEATSSEQVCPADVATVQKLRALFALLDGPAYANSEPSFSFPLVRRTSPNTHSRASLRQTFLPDEDKRIIDAFMMPLFRNENKGYFLDCAPLVRPNAAQMETWMVLRKLCEHMLALMRAAWASDTTQQQDILRIMRATVDALGVLGRVGEEALRTVEKEAEA